MAAKHTTMNVGKESYIVEKRLRGRIPYTWVVAIRTVKVKGGFVYAHASPDVRLGHNRDQLCDRDICDLFMSMKGLLYHPISR